MIEIYRNIKSKEVVDKKSIQNSIKPLRFQLKRQNSYDFYKSNAKFTGCLLDKIFSIDKDYLNKMFKEYSDLNLKKNKSKHISNYLQNLNNFCIAVIDCIFILIRS